MNFQPYGVVGFILGLLLNSASVSVGQQYWNEMGGEVALPPTNECPELGGTAPSTVGGQAVIRHYTKCYKTELEDSVCYQSKGQDCFNVLRTNLMTESRRTTVCCPGACAWIFEHAWIDGQGVNDPETDNAYKPVHARGRLLGPPLAPPGVAVVIAERGGLFPTLRAGCVLELPTPNAPLPAVPVTRPPPRSCPVLAGPGSLDTPGTPLCVQRLYRTVTAAVPAVPAVPPVPPVPPVFLPQTACTIHCCEGDLCNRFGDATTGPIRRPGEIVLGGRASVATAVGYLIFVSICVSFLTTL